MEEEADGAQTQAEELADLRQGACVVGSIWAERRAWTMDFLQDALASGRKLRTLSIEDAYAREMQGDRSRYLVASSARSTSVGRGYGNIEACQYGLSLITARSSLRRLWTSGPDENKVTLHFITPGRPNGVRLPSKASMASSVRSASTNTGSSLWTMRGRPSKAGGSITARCARTAL